MILGPMWGGGLSERLYIMMGVMMALDVILAVSRHLESFPYRLVVITVIIIISPDLSVPSVMRWLTGQRHKPIGSEKLTIDVHFNHECMKVNLNHTICFPTASASRGSISFHLHIWALRPILETFLLAYCKGHSLTINNSKDICQIFYLTNGLCYIFLSS